MPQVLVPIGDVVLSTIQGVSDYWVRLPRGSVPIRNIYTAGTPAVTDGWGVLMSSQIADLTLVVHNCEAAFDEDGAANIAAGCTNTLDAVDFKAGTSSNKFVFTAAAAAGIIACDVIPTTLNRLLAATHLEFWIKCSVATAAGDLQILLDDTAKCVSPICTLDVPALQAGVWRKCRVALADPSLAIAIISVGLKYTVDIGACDIWLDDIRAVKSFKTALTALKVDDFNPDDVYFALSDAIVGEAFAERVLIVNYDGPEQDPNCSS